MTRLTLLVIDRIKGGFVLDRKHKIEGIASIEIPIQSTTVSKSEHQAEATEWLAIGGIELYSVFNHCVFPCCH